jgi:imidazolonepropionase
VKPDLVVRDIDVLLTMTGPGLGRINGAAIAYRDDRVVWTGPSERAPSGRREQSGAGCIGLPGLIDCHTHTVFAGSRAREFERRLAGEDYSAILEQGGGILSTVGATRAASLEELTRVGAERLRHMARGGITTVEVKSGYGLTSADERKMLLAAVAAGTSAQVEVVPTFLGAHTVPFEYRGRRSAYVDQVVTEQLSAVADVAKAIDVYVDRGAFTLAEGHRVLAAGKAMGLVVRVHAEQVTHTGAAAMAAELGASSADHLEHLDRAGIDAMARSGTTAVLLPGAMNYLSDPAPPVAELRKAGVPMAVATDFNPGTSPVRDLWTCATLATIQMGLTVEEALLAVTRHAALALGRQDIGHLRVGSAAPLILVPPPPGEPCEPAVLVQYMGSHTARRMT